MTQHYVGTKQVMAWEQDKDGESGYCVKYSDDYVSWSPKEAFESAYIPVGHIGHLPDYQQRVICELAQLTDKVEKLSLFTQSDGFSKIDEVQSGLLSVQLDLMKAYASVLKNRISAF